MPQPQWLPPFFSVVENRFNDYNQYIQAAMQSWDCPGAAVTLTRGEQLLYRGVFGWRDVENRLPMTEATRFAMAS